MIDHPSGTTAVPPALALVVSKSDWNARAVESILDPGEYVALRATTSGHAVQFARSASPDIVIVQGDLADPALDDVCRALLREDLLGATCPVVVITSNGGPRERRLDLQRLGVWEIFGQPLDPEALALHFSRLLGARRELRRVSERVMIEPETGLYNERGLLRRAAELGAHATRFHEPLACIALRPVSDGAATPPSPAAPGIAPLIVHLANTIAPIVRMSDVLGHLRPRELGVIAMGDGENSAFKLVERMRTAVESSPLVMGGLIRRLSIAAAVCAVPDFAQSAVSAPSLLQRVAGLMRDSGADTPEGDIQIVDPVPRARD
ncbi:MAG TPA: hypothetical protein VHB25_07890 [Gemmatimonadaceae bacterium]|nr:hypothetical protein [Gemmatimonadaceae bacterium]